MSTYTHGLVGHTENESAQHLDSDKITHNFFLGLRTSLEPLVMESTGCGMMKEKVGELGGG